MNVQPLVLVALISVVSTIITTVGVVAVAVINSKKERSDTAENAVERTLRERLALKDEQIADLRVDISERDAAIAERDTRIATLVAENLRLRGGAVT